GVNTQRFTRLLGLGVLLNLLVALAHDNHGVHHVGPIHYSETAVPLTIIAVFGMVRARDWLVGVGVSFRVPAITCLFVVVFGMALFNSWHGTMLQRSTTIQATI